LSLILTIFSNHLWAQDVSLDLIQAKALVAANRVESIAFHSSIEMREGPIASVATPRPQKQLSFGQAEYKQSGDKFWSHLVLTREGQPPMEIDTAFDGRRYQSHDARSGGLMLSDGPALPNATLAGDALYYPYLFLMTEEGSFTPKLLKDASGWRRAFAKATVLSSSKQGALRLHNVEFPGPKAGQTFVVTFAEELDFFPYATQLNERGRNVGSVSVVEHVVLGDAAEPITFPTQLEVVFKTFAKDGATINHTSIRTDPKTIRVNQPLESASFAIPKDRVRVINDVDRMTSERVGDSSGPGERGLGSRGLLGLWLGVALLIVVVAWARRSVWKNRP